MRKFELGGSFETLIPTVQFGNKTVFIHFKESYEGDYTDEQIRILQDEKYKKFCIEPAELQEKEILMDCVQKELKDLRILRCPKCNELHPSVTTVRDFEDKFEYTETLAVATAEGCIEDIRCRHFVSTGEYLPASKIPQCKPHLQILKGSGSQNNFDFTAFLKAYPITDMKNGEREWDCERGITYEPDLLGVTNAWDIGTKKEPSIIQDLPTVFDYKRTPDKVKAFTQMSICAKNNGLKRMVIIPVKTDNQKGYCDPIIENDVDGYIEILMEKRRKFRRRYGI